MLLNVIMFKNKKVNAFTTPQFIDIEPEKAAIQLSRSLQLNDKPEIDATYKNLAMFFMGTFDDSTGKFDLERRPKFLLDCEDVLWNRKKDDEHGRESSQNN